MLPLPNLPAPGRIALRAVTGLVVAAALIWLVVPITVAGVFRDKQPTVVLDLDRAFGFWPDARAQASLARQLAGDGRNAGRLESARAMAASALRRDPAVVGAVSVLGITAALRQSLESAERAFSYAARLSRRDVGAQLWLIERAVQRNDVVGALHHYDTLLRVSPTMANQLFPILSGASRDPSIAVALNRLLRNRPNWSNDFLTFMLRDPSDPRAAFLVSRGLVSPNDPGERERLTMLLRSLTSARAFDLAWQAYVTAWPARARGNALLWNGDFSNYPLAAPFDWGFADDPALAPERRIREGSDFALYLPAGAESEADVARQLVRLPPGQYQLTGMAGGVGDDPSTRPLIIVSCSGEQGAVLARQDLPASPASGRRFAMRLTVPAGCAQQWVAIRVRGSFDQRTGGAAWVDSLAIAGI